MGIGFVRFNRRENRHSLAILDCEGMRHFRSPHILGSAEGGYPDLFRFPRFIPICAPCFWEYTDLLRFLPICFQNTSEQIGPTPFLQPSLRTLGTLKVTTLRRSARSGENRRRDCRESRDFAALSCEPDAPKTED